MNKLPRQPRIIPVFIQNHVTRFTRDTALYNRVATLINEGMSTNAAIKSVANEDDSTTNLPIVRAAYYRLLRHFDWEDAQEIPNAETVKALKEADDFMNSPEFEDSLMSPEEAIAYFRKLIEEDPS